jgi:hypothetical protein
VFVRGINEQGDAVGTNSSFSDDTEYATLWPAGGGEIVIAAGSTADDINDQGLILGRPVFAPIYPVLWSKDGEIAATTTLSAQPRGLNSRGWAVGSTYPPDFVQEPPRAFLWDPKKGVVIILSPTASDASDINDRGEIVGTIGNPFRGEVLQGAIWRITETLEPRQPIADAYVRAGASASANFGASPTLLVKLGVTPDFTRRGYVKFDISGVPTIGQATLRLHGRVSDARNSVRAGIFRVGNQSWDERTVTWNTKPAYNPLLGIATVRGTAPQWVEIDVTAFVQAERQAGRDTISVALRALEHTSSYASFDSRETGEFGPQLIITP